MQYKKIKPKLCAYFFCNMNRALILEKIVYSIFLRDFYCLTLAKASLAYTASDTVNPFSTICPPAAITREHRAFSSSSGFTDSKCAILFNRDLSPAPA